MSDIQPLARRPSPSRLSTAATRGAQGLWTSLRTRGSPLNTRSSWPAACSLCLSEAASGTKHSSLPSAAAMESLRLLQAALYDVLADDDQADEAPRLPGRKTTAPRRIPVAAPES